MLWMSVLSLPLCQRPCLKSDLMEGWWRQEAEINRQTGGVEYRWRSGAMEPSRSLLYELHDADFSPWCLCFFNLLFFSACSSSLWSLALTSRSLADPELPASGGCFNRFIRVKLTHWIKSDGGESCGAAGLLSNSNAHIWGFSFAKFSCSFGLWGGSFCCLRRTSGPPEADVSRAIREDQTRAEAGQSWSAGLLFYHCLSPMRRLCCALFDL